MIPGQSFETGDSLSGGEKIFKVSPNLVPPGV